MKKLVFVLIILLCLQVCNACIVQQITPSPYLELSKIDFSPPYDNQHALYLNIYNTTNIPNFVVLIQGTNVTFDWTRIAYPTYSSPYGTPYVTPIDASSGYFLFKQGTLPNQPFMLMGRLMYTKTTPAGSIDLIAMRPFDLGSTSYTANYVIDTIPTPEPAIICLLGSGLLFFRKKNYEN